MENSMDFEKQSVTDNSSFLIINANSTLKALEDFAMDSNFARLLISLVIAIVWITYITFYHSRVLGFILTKIINRNLFLKDGYFHIGSFTWSVLSGKIMFRDVVYINYDYTVRVQDGWIIFRWWRSYVPKSACDDLSHSDTRLSLMLNGFELHMYNRTQLYANLEKTFGIEPHLCPKDEELKQDNEKGALTSSKKNRSISSSSWRDLIPVIKMDLLSGRVVFGNRLVPTTLSVNIEEAHLVYSTKPAASRLDPYMHFVKCIAENFKVILAPSPKYTGMVDDPPRYMGEGFVVLSSNKVDLYYYMDQPGRVPSEPAMCQLANGDIVESAPPIWGIDVKCGKGTHFSYGPWANRQREHLYKFFFPNSFEPMQLTKPPQPGERRQAQSFDIRLSTQNDATIDILFTKIKETNAVHINIEPGSYLEVTLPWVVQPHGYCTRVRGQLLHVDASTSLLYRALLESETLEFNVRCHFPIHWNDHQDWNISLTGCKATANLIYAHKGFFQDLVNDWSSKARPDLLSFVPYTCKFSLIMKEFEIITQSNKYNWIDCSSTNQENTHIAFAGELFDLSFDLPFTEFLPTTLPVRIWIQGESVDVLLFVPETYTCHTLLHGLSRNAKVLDREGSVKILGEQQVKKWRRVCTSSDGWINCWSVPIVALSINYTYHPQPPLGPPPQADITTPEKEEILLSPMRIPRGAKNQSKHWNKTKVSAKPFHPTSLAADRVSVELEIGSSVMFLYGTLLRHFMHLKENIFGDDQSFTDMGQEKESVFDGKDDVEVDLGKKIESIDYRQYRPLDVIVSVTMHDIQAHIMKNCNEKDPACPMVLIERLGVEMKKGYRETKLQVLLSPSMLLSSDNLLRPGRDSHISNGHLLLSGLQVRGHAMFSDESRSLDQETVEYAWLIEIQLGKLSGKITTGQLYHVITSIDTLFILAADDENDLRSPVRPTLCVHGKLQSKCPINKLKQEKCPTPEDIKYRMTRLAIDALDIYLVEEGTAIHLWTTAMRVSTCNLHGEMVKSGVTALLAVTELRQYISAGTGSASNTNSSARSLPMCDDTWLEVCSLTFGPLLVELSDSLPYSGYGSLQKSFLQQHDRESMRLWFLWPELLSECHGDKEKINRCGCVGGCSFFGSNRNGKHFFKHTRQDVQLGMNIAAFRINDANEDPGFGQSILQKGQLVFHTPPYDSCQFSEQEAYCYWDGSSVKHTHAHLQRSRNNMHEESESKLPTSPSTISHGHSIKRRFSCTPAPHSHSNKEIPYSRLEDKKRKGRHLAERLLGSSESERRRIISIPDVDLQRRNSASDSRLLKLQTVPVHGVVIEPDQETRHSLTLSEDRLYQQVPRTTSMTSDNPSEAYFSADENVASNVCPLTPEANRNKYGSESCIAGGDLNYPGKLCPEPPNIESSHLEAFKHSNEVCDDEMNETLLGSSESDSISSTSFISAVSSQEENGLVNLHMQINRPIIEAPLLMSSYINHLSQANCCNWKSCSVSPSCAFSIPGSLFKKSEDGFLSYGGGNYTPCFRNISEGFTYLRMISRINEQATPPSTCHTPTHPHQWQSNLLDEPIETFEDSCDVAHHHRTSLIVKFQGDIDVMITPLSLESLQRFIDSLIPTVLKLHPLTVLNKLHSECISRVKDANVLKKQEYLSQLPLSPQHHVDSRKKNSTIPVSSGSGNGGVYQQSFCSWTQGVVMMPKINVTLLQASVIEELAPFSALDNVRDFACVSVLALCLDKTTAKFHLESSTQEIMHALQRPAVVPSQKKTGLLARGLLASSHSKSKDAINSDVVFVESSEKQHKQVIVMLSLGKIHAQLRRLPNGSSLLQDALVTAIPPHQSKVMFMCATPRPKLRDRQQDKLGFIMFEAGVEGLSIKVIKNERFEKNVPPEMKAMTPPNVEVEREVLPQPVSVLSQTEQLLTAIKLSSKTAASLNNFIESRNLRQKFESKILSKPTEPTTAKPSVEMKGEKQSNTQEPRRAAGGDGVAAATDPLEKSSTEGNTASAVIQLATVWFNFAAPPPTPITRKIDYTRLDWNLLSTVSPAINAWMNPSSRFAARLVLLLRTKYRRTCGVLACLMAEALEVPEIHSPNKSRYGRLTALAKTLQEDPSCQLCNVLHKYVLISDLSKIEEFLNEPHLPALTVLRQGVIVLSRQWKSVLYTPLLLDHNYKLRHLKPFNVPVPVPEQLSPEEQDVSDEYAILIDSDVSSPEQKNANNPGVKWEEKEINTSVLTSPTSTSLPSAGGRIAKKKRLPPLNPPSSSRASIAFPITIAPQPSFVADVGYGVLHEDERNLGSNNSTGSNVSRHSMACPDSYQEDLYSWMAKQQEFVKENITEEPQTWIPAPTTSVLGAEGQEDTEQEGSPIAGLGYNMFPVHDSLCLLDAHLIFQPLLLSLGVYPQQMLTSGSSAVFDTWGTSLSLVGSMEALRVDIVVSEFRKTADKKNGKDKGRGEPKIQLDIPSEVPSFLCERIGIEVDVKTSADMSADDMLQKQNVLYISRGQLKKHTSTHINFTINIHYISQQVNMPLLRLLQQISSMYQNVKDTQLELKQQQTHVAPRQPNGSSSASDVQEHMSSITEQDHSKTLMPSSPSIMTAHTNLLGSHLHASTITAPGYNNTSRSSETPLILDSSAESGASKPRCWKTVSYLLDLYATTPETKTIPHRFSVAPEVFDGSRARRRTETVTMRTLDDMEKGLPTSSTPVPFERAYLSGERTRLLVFGVARIHRTRLLATLSGLKLEAEITHLQSSITCKKRQRPDILECSLTGQVGRTMILLLEGVAPNQQTVVKVTVGKSQTLYSSLSAKNKDKNSGLLTVGAINIDIPQHPVALHGMMTRGSKQLSSTLQELGVTRVSRLVRGSTIDETENTSSLPTPASTIRAKSNQPTSSVIVVSPLLQPLVMHFSIILQSLSITAALLPSLQAQYKMDQVNSSGMTGSKAKFTVDLPRHSLSFTTKLQVSEANLPSEASIDLPKVHVSAEYVQDADRKFSSDSKFADGVVLRKGSYLNATADIGRFEHCLTTDLLNHLVFVQKVFMKEVNEVVQKVYGGEKVVPLWQEEDDSSSRSSQLKTILFSLIIRIQRIQLTATTPTNSAVRLETGAVELELSNRVENVSGGVTHDSYMKVFGKASVDVNLSLGQLLKNVLFEEAEPEFQQYAFFKTRIGLRNAFQGEMVEGEDKEVVLITLKRPLIYMQPMAVDKAILVWLNYKTAYEYWNEQRTNLNTEVLTATQQVLEKVPFGTLGNAPHLGTLFLQLTVDDMGICLPLNPLPLTTWGLNRSVYLCEPDTRGAVVITLESTIISACSSGSLVSKGRFVGLCLRFAEDFEASLDDWKPNANDSAIMNLCVVSEGTYEVCSRTIAQRQPQENAKWFLNVQWQMEGVDIHLDVNVGKQLSALGHTLTMLTGSTDEEDTVTLDYDSDEADGFTATCSSEDSLPAFLFDPSLDAKRRSKLIEREMQETTKNIQTLRCLGASQGTIEHEVKRLRDIEAVAYKDFRRDMIQKLKRQSVKASSIKGKLGLGKNAHLRSRSFMVPSPTPEHGLDLESPTETGTIAGVASIESSPLSGPSRTASLRAKNSQDGPRVTFSEARNICRQSSLPSANSGLSIPSDLEWGTDHVIVDGEKVTLRRKLNDGSADQIGEELSGEGGSPGITGMPSGLLKQQEPNIDFELDVKVFINSGKCVLHTKDSFKDEEMRFGARMRKERSCSGGMFEFPPPSPNMARRNKDGKQSGAASGSSTRGRYLHGNLAQLVDLTIFHIPGLDVKVHYESRMESEESVTPELGMQMGRRPTNKKASLYAWTTLQSIPEETIISPHILEFLEQTLEPIPNLPSPGKHVDLTSGMFSKEQGTGWAGTGSNYVYASFPVDVMVYFHMEPSTFRFSCLPASRVECMLQLPSLDIVFSSKRAEEELFGEFGESMEGFAGLLEPGFPSTAVGGLSVTGCLSNFSVHIFHPYGGGNKTSSKEAQWSPLADSERKDSLSINVEFVKFHLSRSRKINLQSEPCSSLGEPCSRAAIRFSTIVDIGSASFKYDMRRLTEILAFPKAWYRRTIVRRLFLGELNVGRGPVHSDGGRISPLQKSDDPLHHRIDPGRFDVEDGGLGQPSRSPNAREKLRLNLGADQKPRFKDLNRMDTLLEDSSGKEKGVRSSWETLVLFAVNFTKLSVQMSMGNVMGNAMWLTKDFHSEGRLSIGSTGHKNMYIGLGLGGCNLDAKGGIVGGTIELSQIDTFIHIREDPGTEPDHTVGVKLNALELRLDYMGSGVLMSRISALTISLRDEWKIHNFNNTDSYIPTRRPAMIFMHGDMGWDQLQIIISESTTADLLKMFNKLDEFFSQQFQSSKRVFSSFQPRANSRIGESVKRKTIRKKSSSGSTNGDGVSNAPEQVNHHRHWQHVLAAVGGLSLYTFKIPLPLNGTVLGGTMELHGTNISLACFHGINFKSKSWALFSLKQPCISFATEAQEIPSQNNEGRSTMQTPMDVHVVQTLTFSLGISSDSGTAHNNSMATICRMSRNALFPPQYKTLYEWFHYTFASSEIDAVDRFPSLERDRLETPSSDETRRRGGVSSKPGEHSHTREVIFALPSLQLHLKTEHLQGSATPDQTDGVRPVVECSFITEFEDHIFVTIDAEGFFFLHDLISSYIKEKDKVSASLGARAPSPEVDSKKTAVSTEDEKKRQAFDPEDMFTKDWRTYECKTWHLEPTLRLWSWAGKSIEPYGIDFILQKLGFTHARTTIPKWMQRGFMDPLDKVLAVLMVHMVSMVKDSSNAPQSETSRSTNN